MSKTNIFQRLKLRQWGWLWSAYWRLWPVLIRIKFKQFFKDANWLRKKVTIIDHQTENKESDSQRATQMHESVRLAARLHFFSAECLPRSIVLADMLNADGAQASVVIGVSKKSNNFISHAWVELDGSTVMERETVKEEFTILES